MRFFFYGTLMDDDVRRAVLGALAPPAVEPACLEGWQRLAVRGASYPVVAKARGARVEGVLTRGLDAGAVRLLSLYEDKAYRRIKVVVRPATGRRNVAAEIFVPARRSALHGTESWDYATWQRRDKAALLARIKAWMKQGVRR